MNDVVDQNKKESVAEGDFYSYTFFYLDWIRIPIQITRDKRDLIGLGLSRI